MSFVRVIVGNRNGAKLAELDADVLNVSWRLNEIGKCEFSIANTNPKATAVNLQYNNRVVLQFTNGLPDWGGVIQPPRKWDGHEIKVTALSAEHILKTRTTDKGRYFTADTVGSIFQALINEMNIDYDTGIAIGDIYLGGTVHSPDYHFKSILSIIQDSLTKRLSTCDFAITPNITDTTIGFLANFYEQRGTSKTSFALIQGNNVKPLTLTEQGTIINKWHCAGEGTGWGNERITAEAFDTASIELYGLQEGSAIYGDVSVLGTLQDNAENLLSESAYPYNIFSVKAISAPPAYFSDYDIGDIITLQAHNIGFGGTNTTVRVLAREFFPQDEVCNLVVQEQND